MLLLALLLTSNQEMSILTTNQLILCSSLLLQDYLGGFIVFVAMIVSLVSATLLPGLVSPALVGLAINYTLLVPIYLNWVVKFLADMEMYMGAVERVTQYANAPSEDYRLCGESTRVL